MAILGLFPIHTFSFFSLLSRFLIFVQFPFSLTQLSKQMQKFHGIKYE